MEENNCLLNKIFVGKIVFLFSKITKFAKKLAVRGLRSIVCNS